MYRYLLIPNINNDRPFPLKKIVFHAHNSIIWYIWTVYTTRVTSKYIIHKTINLLDDVGLKYIYIFILYSVACLKSVIFYIFRTVFV